MSDDSPLNLAADDVRREAAEVTDGRIGAAPGEHPFVQCGREQPRAPLESEAAFLDAAHAFAVAGMNSLPQETLTATAFKIDNHGARLWVSVDRLTVALVLELRGECVELARHVVEIDPLKLN